ncbi:MAG: hypothetical protein HY369_05205 [Candidatus Aenigmarchaeota archaeon]|nr:hypothetical protein [Candidatus Aenigmarchaeota archaeon]
MEPIERRYRTGDTVSLHYVHDVGFPAEPQAFELVDIHDGYVTAQVAGCRPTFYPLSAFAELLRTDGHQLVVREDAAFHRFLRVRGAYATAQEIARRYHAAVLEAVEGLQQREQRR